MNTKTLDKSKVDSLVDNYKNGNHNLVIANGKLISAYEKSKIQVGINKELSHEETCNSLLEYYKAHVRIGNMTDIMRGQDVIIIISKEAPVDLSYINIELSYISNHQVLAVWFKADDEQRVMELDRIINYMYALTKIINYLNPFAYLLTAKQVTVEKNNIIKYSKELREFNNKFTLLENDILRDRLTSMVEKINEDLESSKTKIDTMILDIDKFNATNEDITNSLKFWKELRNIAELEGK